MPHKALYPPVVPWYRAQNLVPQCPHCSEFLRDRTVPRVPWRWQIAGLGLILLSGRVPWQPWPVLAAVVAVLVAHYRHYRRSIRGMAPENRYVPLRSIVLRVDPSHHD